MYFTIINILWRFHQGESPHGRILLCLLISSLLQCLLVAVSTLFLFCFSYTFYSFFHSLPSYQSYAVFILYPQKGILLLSTCGTCPYHFILNSRPILTAASCQSHTLLVFMIFITAVNIIFIARFHINENFTNFVSSIILTLPLCHHDYSR
jgi:hypothetical protein